MSEKSIHEIESDFGDAVAQTGNEFAAAREKIVNTGDYKYAEQLPYYVRDESDAQRAVLIKKAREADVQAARERASAKAEAAFDSYPKAVAKRREELEGGARSLVG